MNAKTADDLYPLSNPNEVLSVKAGKPFMSKIGLSQAFFQMPLAPECQEIITLQCHMGTGHVRTRVLFYNLLDRPASSSISAKSFRMRLAANPFPHRLRSGCRRQAIRRIVKPLNVVTIELANDRYEAIRSSCVVRREQTTEGGIPLPNHSR